LLAEASTILATDFDVVAAVRDGQHALDASLRRNPDVAILDIGMPGFDSMECRACRKHFLLARIE
jgi:DNA-binding NarL/FixJ family response regulator